MTRVPSGPAAHATGREKLTGHLAMLLFAALIAGSFSLGDVAVNHVGPAAINAVRFVIGTAIMAIAAALVLRRSPVITARPWRFAILGGLMAAYFLLMFVALGLSGPVSTGAVFTLIPLMSAGFGWLFLGQRTRFSVLVSLVVAACGAIWVIFQGNIDAILGLRIGKGEAIFFIGCAAHAAYAPLVRKLNSGEPVIAFTAMTLAATTVWVLIVGSGEVFSTSWSDLPAIVWITIFYLGVFTTAGTFFLLQYASMRLPASKVLSYGYLTPSFIILFEGLAGHGWAPLTILAGAMVTDLALVFMALAPDQ